jgi:hypothetical protein
VHAWLEDGGDGEQLRHGAEQGTGQERAQATGDGGVATTGRAAAVYGVRESGRAHVGRESESTWSGVVSLNRRMSDDVSGSYGT